MHESEVTQLYPTLCNPVDCSPPGSFVHRTFQARALEWGAIVLPPQPHLNGKFLSKMWSSDLNVSDTSTLGSRHFLDLLLGCQNNHTVISIPCPHWKEHSCNQFQSLNMVPSDPADFPQVQRLLLLSRFSRVRLCVTPQTAAHQAPRPWDSPGKNTGVGCHFLLQCMKVKVKSLSRV